MGFLSVNHRQQPIVRSIPERSCIGCGAKRSKRELARLVKDGQGVMRVDARQEAPGRGAYLCSPACLKAAARKKALSRAFRGRCDAPDLDQLEVALSQVFVGGKGSIR